MKELKVFIPSWFDDLELTAQQFRIYCHLSRRSNQEGECYPSLKLISATCKISINTIQTALTKLEEKGLIKIESGGNHVSNRYTLARTEKEIETYQSNYLNVSKENTLDSEVNVSIDSQKRINPLTKTYQSTASKVIQEGNPLRESSIGDAPEKDDDFSLSQDSQNEDQPEPTAEEIYQAYPKKVAKPQAIQAISKALKQISATELLEKTEAYARIIKESETPKQFTPNPATWYNQERYNDDRETWASNGRASTGENPRVAGTLNQGRTYGGSITRPARPDDPDL